MDITKFPDIQAYRSMNLLPIYFEPIFSSGERILLVLLAYSESGQAFQVINRIDKINCFFKEQSKFVNSILVVLEEDLKEILETKDFQNINRRFSLDCLHLGECTQVQGIEETQIVKTMLEENSVLYDCEFVENIILNRKEAPINWGNLNNVIFGKVTQKKLEWSAYFSRSAARKTNEGFLKTNEGQIIDYLGHNVAANFCYFGGKRIRNNLHCSAAKLLDLQYTVDCFEAQFDGHSELVIYLPESGQDPSLITNIRGKITQLDERASTLGLGVRTYDSPSSMCERLIFLDS